MSGLTLQPIALATDSGDQDGLLVMLDGRLVAIIVRLEDTGHSEQRGGWFLEVGFGRLSGPVQPIFADLNAAQDWIDQHASSRRNEETRRSNRGRRP